MFEVQDLRYATLATVSRCGMVWFSEDVLSTEMIFDNNLMRMKRVPIEEFEEETRRIKARGEEENSLSPAMQVWKIKAPHEGEILIFFLSLNSQPKEPFAPKIPQFPEPKCQWKYYSRKQINFVKPFPRTTVAPQIWTPKPFGEQKMSFSQTVGWAGSSKNGSQHWFRKQWIALTQTKLTMNPSSEKIELRANKNLSNKRF